MEIPSEVQQIIRDIKEIKIQGATAVAEATFKGLDIYLSGYKKVDNFEVFMVEVEELGLLLAKARPNEPLARNGLKYLFNMYRIKYPGEKEVETARAHLMQIANDFLALLEAAKKQIVTVGVSTFSELTGVMTHCHSSTVERMFEEISKLRAEKGFSVVATETRPLYQGRITAKNLLDRGIDVKMVVDSAVTSFLVGHWDIPVDVVFTGCDEITIQGDTLNKVGSYSIALSAYYAGKPLYVVGTLLKLDPSTIYDRPRIEMRSGKEVWPDAPENLQIINPAFELIPHELVTGFVTEFGVVKAGDVEKELSRHYEWLW
jgi:ribose 1,5-bisphosphate isomerase